MSRISLTALILIGIALAAGAQSVTLSVSPNPAPTGQQMRITLSNGTTSMLLMASSNPWAIVDASNQPVFGPVGLPVVTSLAPGKSRWWTWDQKDVHSKQVPDGGYTVHLHYALSPTGPGLTIKTPFTVGATSTLSVSGTPSPGRTISLLLRSPNFVGRGYQVALALGKSPGIPMGGGRVLPLNPDPLFFASLTVGPPVFNDFAGLLDSSGRATAKLAIPNIAQLKGTRFFAVFAVFHLAAPNGIAEASAATQLVVQ